MQESSFTTDATTEYYHKNNQPNTLLNSLSLAFWFASPQWLVKWNLFPLFVQRWISYVVNGLLMSFVHLLESLLPTKRTNKHGPEKGLLYAMLWAVEFLLFKSFQTAFQQQLEGAICKSRKDKWYLSSLCCTSEIKGHVTMAKWHIIPLLNPVLI